MDSAFFAVVDDEGGVCQPCSYWPLCAPVDCCMYAAAALEDSTLNWEDLPVTLYDPLNDRTFDRVEPYEEGGVTVYYEAPDDGDEQQIIYIEQSASPWEWNSGTVPSAGGPCLITGDGNYTPGDDAVEDEFSACYSVTGFFVGSPVSVERISLCVWQAEVDGILVGLSFNSIEQKWYGFEDNTYLYPKMPDENQSSPLGEYGSPGSPDDLVYLTVTEC